jgi:hypothetical protein
MTPVGHVGKRDTGQKTVIRIRQKLSQLRLRRKGKRERHRRSLVRETRSGALYPFAPSECPTKCHNTKCHNHL